ncbi:hypothetical protein ABPG73_005280 [Tetrahymena malaccensis]
MADPVTGIIIGSCIFIFLGIVAYCVIDNYVKKSFQSNAPKLNSERTLYYENRGTVIVSVIISVIGMWLLWVTCYMHQMYPLITPIPHSH